MKIIDPNTGKRIKQEDPIYRTKEKLVNDEGLSPMSPPDFTNPPAKMDKIPFEKYAPSIQKLIKEHEEAIQQINIFEDAMIRFKESGFILSQDLSGILRNFFEFFDTVLIPHHQKEDRFLFPVLEKYLLQQGEHSKYMSGQEYETAVDVMADDHLKMMQVGSLIFNLLGIFSRIPDPVSRGIIADIVYNKSMEMIDLLRTHIYQEEYTLFPMAARYFSSDEFEKINQKII